MTEQWRVCLDCGTEWDANEVAEDGACTDCGGPTTPTGPERARAHRLYLDRKRDIAALLDWLSLEVDKATEYTAKKGGPNYTDAGDLIHVHRKLIETLSFLAHRDKEDIEKALDEVRAGREQAGELRETTPWS